MKTPYVHLSFWKVNDVRTVIYVNLLTTAAQPKLVIEYFQKYSPFHGDDQVLRCISEFLPEKKSMLTSRNQFATTLWKK
jgi:hypothetical protein